jgi:hypothetical protein
VLASVGQALSDCSGACPRAVAVSGRPADVRGFVIPEGAPRPALLTPGTSGACQAKIQQSAWWPLDLCYRGGLPGRRQEAGPSRAGVARRRAGRVLLIPVEKVSAGSCDF